MNRGAYAFGQSEEARDGGRFGNRGSRATVPQVVGEVALPGARHVEVDQALNFGVEYAA